MEIQVTTNDKNQVGIFLRGPINEESDHKFKLLEQQLTGQNQLYFIFEGVTSVDSLGVRAWVHFLRSLRGPSRAIHFVRCNADIISQINMIPSFAEGALIDSFFVNYVCPSCEHSTKVLASTAAIPKGKFPPSPTCPQCKQATMETEELEDEYFSFLTRHS